MQREKKKIMQCAKKEIMQRAKKKLCIEQEKKYAATKEKHYDACKEKTYAASSEKNYETRQENFMQRAKKKICREQRKKLCSEQKKDGDASLMRLLLFNAFLVHCFLVFGAIYFWCCVFGAMYCQLHRAGLLPQWRIYFMIVTTVISCHIIVVKFSHLFNLIPTSTLFQVCFPCFTSSQWND